MHEVMKGKKIIRDPDDRGLYVAQKQTNHISALCDLSWVRTKLSSLDPLCKVAALRVWMESTKPTVPPQDFSRAFALHSLCIASQHGQEVLRSHILQGIGSQSQMRLLLPRTFYRVCDDRPRAPSFKLNSKYPDTKPG